MKTAIRLEPMDVKSIPFQEASLDIWDKKYRLTAKDGTPIDATMDDTYKRVARALADVEREDVREHWYERFLWALRRGRDSRRPHHLQRRRARAQARHLDDQLHRVRHHPRLDGRHPGQGARGRPHAEGRLRHRLRILDAASARRVRLRRRRVHLRPAVVHGYLRQDVLHRVLGRRPPRRADGHVRRRPSGRDGVHPRQARGRPPAPVQPVAADHRRVHARRCANDGDWKLAFPLSHARNTRPSSSTCTTPSKFVWREWPTHEGYVTQRRRPGRLQDLQDACRARRMWDVIMVVDVRLRRAGLHPDRPRQRDEQQLVVREHPRHQPVRRAAAAAVRLVPAGLGEPHALRAQPVHRRRRVRLGGVPRSRARVHAHARQRGRDQRPAARAAARRDHAQAPPRHGLPRPRQHDHAARHEVRLAGVRASSPRTSRARWRWPAGKRRSSWRRRRARRRS